MNLSAITSADLKRLASLVEQKESLFAEVARIDRELRAFGSGSAEPVAQAVPRAVGRPPGKSAKVAKAAKPGKRGRVKEAIIGLLQAAGKDGQSVKEIAATLGAKDQNIYMWFSATGKGVKGIKKIGPGRYSWVG